jgi:hypothetical protein
MSEQGSGLEIALQRIEKEAQERTDFLDLGRLGLTELPEDLFRLTHTTKTRWRTFIGVTHKSSKGSHVQ